MKKLIGFIGLLFLTNVLMAQAAPTGQSYGYEYAINSKFYKDDVIRVYFSYHVHWSKKSTSKDKKDIIVSKDSTISNHFTSIQVNSTKGKLCCYIKQQTQDTFSLAFDTSTNNKIIRIVRTRDSTILRRSLALSVNDTFKISNLKTGQIFIISPNFKEYTYSRFDYKGISFNAASIPFALEAYRFSFKDFYKSFSTSEFETQFFNAGLAINWKWGFLRYNKNVFSATYQPNTVEFGFGTIIGLTSYAITKSIQDTAANGTTIPVFRLGGDLFVSWHSINVMFCVGSEYAFGGNARGFNYEQQLWVGVGVGVQISQIFQSLQNREWDKNGFQQ